MRGILSKSLIPTDIKVDHSLILKRYHEQIEAYGVLGETVVALLKAFKGLHNLWIIPLFLVFKRFMQIRMSIVDILRTNQNIFGYQHADSLVQSAEY